VKEAELVAGVVSPIPTGRKDCGGRQDRQALDVLDTRGRYGTAVAGLSLGVDAGG